MKINLIRIALIAACIVSFSLMGFTRTNHGRVRSVPDQWFDSYGDLSWEDEKAHLDNFAIAMQHDPELVGYIIVFAGRRACVGEAKDRALRAKKYIVETRGIQKNRIKRIDGGYREELTVILQPSPRGKPKPTPLATLKSSEVQIITKCKPKSPDSRMGAS